MQIQLTRKLADQVDGIDLSEYREGDVLDLPEHDAELLIAEQWAVAVSIGRDRRGVSTAFAADCAHDTASRRIRVAADSDRNKQRRAEDRIREELRDSRSVTAKK
jgi:hypothetical protein